MSYLYNDGNYITTRDSFLGRKAYKQNAKLKNVTLLDTWYQYPNYGLLNKDFHPVVLNEDETTANVPSFGSYAGDSVSAAPFVVEAFNDFRAYYVSTTLEKNVQFPPFIDQVIPKLGYISFDARYQDYVATNIDSYARLILDRIPSFDSFNQEMFKVVSSNIHRNPITKSGFLLSERCPINVSGLCVELALIDFDSDAEKVNLLDTKEFQCYAEVADVFGFYIDKNAPWRLIANLQHSVMKKYIDIYRPGTDTDIVLDKTFRSKTEYEDITSVYYFYSAVHKEMTDILGVSRSYTFPEEELISETLKIRMLETGIPMSEFGENNNKILDLNRIYAERHPGNPLKQASGKIGKLCASKLKEIYLAKSNIDSYNKTTLKEYSDFTNSRY